METWQIQLIYITVAFISTAISSGVNWKAYGDGETFDATKFFSAYVRTAWAMIPTAILFASQGLTIELAFGLAGLAFGIDNSVKSALELGKKAT